MVVDKNAVSAIVSTEKKEKDKSIGITLFTRDNAECEPIERARMIACSFKARNDSIHEQTNRAVSTNEIDYS